jgi:hypothetical protein
MQLNNTFLCPKSTNTLVVNTSELSDLNYIFCTACNLNTKSMSLNLQVRLWSISKLKLHVCLKYSLLTDNVYEGLMRETRRALFHDPQILTE